jgi:hypothetical protein
MKAFVEPSERLEEKHATNPTSWHADYWCFLHRQHIGWSRSRVPVLRLSCELRRATKDIIVYPGLGPCYEVIAIRPTFFVLVKKNSVTKGVS